MKLVKVKGPVNKCLYKRVGVDGTETFYIVTSKVGKGRLEESLKTSYLEEARRRRDERLAQFLGTTSRHKKLTALVCDRFEVFMEMKKIKAKGTYDSIKNQWEHHLSDYFGAMYLDDITETEWIKYVASKRVTHPDRKFFNDRKYLSMFLHWLHRNGELQKLPRLPNVDPEIKVGKSYSKDEIHKLIDNSSEDLKLQILCAYTMGMRLGEIFSLEWSQIDFKKKTVHLPAEKTKIRKARTFGLSEVCYGLLKERKVASSSRFVFPAPNDSTKHLGRTGNKTAWTRARHRAKVSGRFHDIRHSFLTEAFKNSVNPALICCFAGLSLEEATRTYLHLNVEDTRVVSSLVLWDVE